MTAIEFWVDEWEDGMKAFVVALPYFDASMTVCAYRLYGRNAEKLYDARTDFQGVGEALLSPSLDVVETVGIEPFAVDKPLLVEINHFQLMMGLPAMFDLDPQRLVCILPRDLPCDVATLDQCHALKAQGYTLAMDGLPEERLGHALFPLLEQIILDYRLPGFAADLRLLTSNTPDVRLLFDHIPDMATYQSLAYVRHALYGGTFYSQPITRGISEIAPIKLNALHLLRQLNEEDFDLNIIAKTIERDPSLSISLLQFINSNARRVGPRRRIDSIQNAVTILGQKEVRRWATIAVSVRMAADRPDEIIRISLLRAKFAENLATAFQMGVFASSLFLCGLFSLLHVILELPMEQAIQEVAVDERIRQALVDQAGPLAEVLRLVYIYERADWDALSVLMIRMQLDPDLVTHSFLDALVWYKRLLEEIDEEEIDSTMTPGDVWHGALPGSM